MALRRAIFLLFGLLSLFGEESLWCVDVRPLPQWLVAVPGLILLLHAVRPAVLPRAATAAAVILASVALANSLRYCALSLPSLPPVPAHADTPVRGTPWFVAREIPAFWRYLVGPTG